MDEPILLADSRSRPSLAPRFLVFGIAVILAVAGLGVRLFQLQLAEGSTYAAFQDVELTTELARHTVLIGDFRLDSVAQILVSADTGDGAGGDIQRINVGSTLPEDAKVRVADEACVDPVFDVTIAATHFHGACCYINIVARGAEFQQRCEDAHQAGCLLISSVGLFELNG